MEMILVVQHAQVNEHHVMQGVLDRPSPVKVPLELNNYRLAMLLYMPVLGSHQLYMKVLVSFHCIQYQVMVLVILHGKLQNQLTIQEGENLIQQQGGDSMGM